MNPLRLGLRDCTMPGSGTNFIFPLVARCWLEVNAGFRPAGDGGTSGGGIAALWLGLGGGIDGRTNKSRGGDIRDVRTYLIDTVARPLARPSLRNLSVLGAFDDTGLLHAFNKTFGERTLGQASHHLRVLVSCLNTEQKAMTGIADSEDEDDKPILARFLASATSAVPFAMAPVELWPPTAGQPNHKFTDPGVSRNVPKDLFDDFTRPGIAFQLSHQTDDRPVKLSAIRKMKTVPVETWPELGISVLSLAMSAANRSTSHRPLLDVITLDVEGENGFNFSLTKQDVVRRCDSAERQVEAWYMRWCARQRRDGATS